MNTNESGNNPYDALEKIFHEPNRLAIMSTLCAADRRLSFGDLKSACNLTDGNLNRHLKVLEEAGAIGIHKSFAGSKPRTMVFLSKDGWDRFNEYLAALEEVLVKARDAVAEEPRTVKSMAGLAPAKA